MRKLFIFFVLLALIAAKGLPAGLVDTRLPSGLKLPATLNFSSGWQRQGQARMLSGKAGVLEIGAWFSGNRPPRGEMVVLELEYRDNLKSPARAEVYSGLGITRSWSELHRFGGLDDGKWKTARIPASADFIMGRLPENIVSFRIQDADGMAVRSARLVAARPGDEERYNAETRAWVARVQKKASVDPSYWDQARSPVLPGSWQDAPLVPYARNWMNLVMPVSAPREGEAGAPLSARMFLNEYETVQLGVYANGRALNDVQVSVGPLKDAKGKTVATAQVRVAEYSLVHGYTMKNYFAQPFPQRLWPAYPFSLEVGRSQLVYLVLHTDEASARAGRYKTEVTVAAAGLEPVTIPLTVEILPRRLLTMEEAGLKLGGCTTGLLPEFEMGFLNGYNHNMINIWYAGIRPELSKKGDGFEMDFRLIDEFMAAAKRQGINHHVYFLGGNPYGFPRTMHLPRTLASTVLGIDDRGWAELQGRDRNRLPPQVAPLVTEWARRVRAHALEKDWPEVVLTPFDEPAKWHQYSSSLGMLHFIKPQFKQQVALLRKGWPEAPIYGSIHHYYGGIEFLEDVDIYCTNAVAENWDMPMEVRDAGKTLWQYSGTTDKSMPAVARYTFGFYFAGHGSVGSLVWAYNWGNRFDTMDGSNWMYAWNTPFDVVPMPYAEGLREAWDDRRLLETLKRTAAAKGVNLENFLSRLYAEFASSRGQGGTSTLDDFWEKAKSDLVMENWRARMTDKLLELEGN
jgi:glycosyl hydrolase family 123